MITINNNDELRDQFNLLKLQGQETIPSHMEFDWANYLAQYKKMDTNDAKEFLDKCRTIVKYLLKFRNYASGRDIAASFYQEFSHKTNYSKDIANVIATFAPFPENVQYLQGYYESFPDITQEEESALTEKINKINNLNDIMNLGLDYTNARTVCNASMLNVELNGETIPVMLWTNDLYCGVSEQGELITYKQIGDKFDVLYTLKEDETYTRMIYRHAKLTPSGMLPEKTITTDQDNKIISVDNSSILINPNFFDLNNKVAYYKKLGSKVATIDRDVSLIITQEAIKLSDTTESNKTVCEDIFDKMSCTTIANNPQVK